MIFYWDILVDISRQCNFNTKIQLRETCTNLYKRIKIKKIPFKYFHLTDTNTLKIFSDLDPVLILFYTDWCIYCKRMMPEFEKLKTMVKDKYVDVKIIQVNCDKYPDLAKKMKVDSYPTLYFLPRGLNDPRSLVHYE